MIDLNTPIVPYKGTGIFELNDNYNNVVARMKSNHIEYDEEIIEHDYSDDPPWTIITIGDDDIELFFAKDRLWKITLCNNFKGALPNGINLDTPIVEAQRIDPTLKFDDWEEFFGSSNGYWIEDNLDTKKLLSITIFIPAVESDDFYKYDW